MKLITRILRLIVSGVGGLLMLVTLYAIIVGDIRYTLIHILFNLGVASLFIGTALYPRKEARHGPKRRRTIW